VRKRFRRFQLGEAVPRLLSDYAIDRPAAALSSPAMDSLRIAVYRFFILLSGDGYDKDDFTGSEFFRGVAVAG
jgi:hypothetical protein